MCTDINGNTDTASQYITVIDNQPPRIKTLSDINQYFNTTGNYTVPSLLATDICGIYIATYNITGATNRTGTDLDASGSFNVGTSVITYTVTDVNGNVTSLSVNIVIAGAVTASYTVSGSDVFCNQLILTANVTQGASYSWKQGGVLVSAQQTLSLGLMSTDGVYELTTINANDYSSSSPATYTYNKQSVAGNYTILVANVVKPGTGNKVATGSAGVTNTFGAALFKQNSSVA